MRHIKLEAELCGAKRNIAFVHFEQRKPQQQSVAMIEEAYGNKWLRAHDRATKRNAIKEKSKLKIHNCKKQDLVALGCPKLKNKPSP